MASTREERRFRWLMALWAAAFSVGALAALTPPVLVEATAARLPWLVNHQEELMGLYRNPVLAVAAAAGEVQLAVVAWLIVWGVRRHDRLADFIIVGKFVFITGSILFLVAGDPTAFVSSLLLSGLAFDTVQLVTTVTFRARAVRSRP